MKTIWRLQGVAQHYQWGGREFIANLVGANDKEVIAEWWLGAHPKMPSLVLIDDQYQALDAIITAAPQNWLGQEVAHHFKSLPFLLKVLDIQKMLSIQVHPDLTQAKAGFGKEQAKNKPLAERNYQDSNHKPEMLFALSPCYLLHGFRDVSAIAAHFRSYSALADLSLSLQDQSLQQSYEMVLRLPYEAIAQRFHAIEKELQEATLPWSKNTTEYWLLRALSERRDYGDCGLWGFFFLNLRLLEPGQTLYQPARMPHAYLSGQNIELMANSDNVLRAGLTTKHVDVEELLTILEYTPTLAPTCMPETRGAHSQYYAPPCPDFALKVFEFKEAGTDQLTSNGPQIIFILQGSLQFDESDEEVYTSGQSAFITPSANARFYAIANTKFFCACMPE